jgi:hypothetical protein
MSKYIWYAAIAAGLVVLAYACQFYFHLEYKLSSDPEDWAQLGDFLGGVLNPILAFISIALLLRTLELQHAANTFLKKDLETKDKTERYRMFEAIFFSLINSQRELYRSFRIEVLSSGVAHEKTGAQAVIHIEEKISDMRERSANDDEVREYLESIDSDDEIYSLVRSFSVIVKLINERLNNENDFTFDERKKHINTLLNLTEFPNIRLIALAVQFMDCHPSEYLRTNTEFLAQAEDSGIELKGY